MTPSPPSLLLAGLSVLFAAYGVAASTAHASEVDAEEGSVIGCILLTEIDVETPRYDVETHVHQLTILSDLQIEQIAATRSADEARRLRSEHYAWKLNRDVRCAEVGRRSSDAFAELDCLSAQSEEYLTRRAAELAESEEGESPAPVR